jgi:NhaP-type Na+/H+ or K+/H+ antiporter
MLGRVIDLAIIALALAAVALIRRRFETTPVTAPMLYVGFGLVIGPHVLGILQTDVGDESVALVAELTLAMLLFSDAARIDARTLRHHVGLPARLLGIGLPLSVAMGTVVTALLLTDVSWEMALLIAAIVSPTDAALGEAVVSNPAVPARVRQALNIESGLNDGMVVPVVALALAMVEGAEVDGAGSLVWEAFREIGLGVAVGAGMAVVASQLVPRALRRGLTDAEGARLVSLGVALAAFGLSSGVGGNGFIAAFVCGLAVRTLLGPTTHQHLELVEDLGQVGAAVTFMGFGALLLWPAFELATMPVVVCAIAALTVGRIVPVAAATLGTGMRAPTVGFLGWFGPRGLASMVFALLAVSESEIDAPDEFLSVIVIVITASVVLHGLTAAPAAKRYGAWFATSGTAASLMESGPAQDAPMRGERRSPTATSSDNW